jgi:magnesium-transporting ATPase (P-type)
MEKRLNALLLMIFGLNLAVFAVSVAVGVVYSVLYSASMPYLFVQSSEKVNFPYSSAILQLAGTFFILFTYLIPISLFVTIELVRIVQGKFMRFDEKLAVSPKKRCCPRNTNLNEDLGAIQFLFTDKTGTLTRNEMKISKWFVRSVGVLDEAACPGILEAAERDAAARQLGEESLASLRRFRRLITVCNSVLPARSDTGEGTACLTPSQVRQPVA